MTLSAQILSTLTTYARGNGATLEENNEGHTLTFLDAGITIDLTEIAKLIADEVRRKSK